MTDKLAAAVALLEEHANEGDRVHHAWPYICRYCGGCSDDELEHRADCPFVALRES